MNRVVINRVEFHSGSNDARVLGGDGFAERVLESSNCLP